MRRRRTSSAAARRRYKELRIDVVAFVFPFWLRAKPGTDAGFARASKKSLSGNFHSRSYMHCMNNATLHTREGADVDARDARLFHVIINA